MYLILLNGGIKLKAQYFTVLFILWEKEMIKLSKYQNGALSIIKIKQCDSIKDLFIYFCSLRLFGSQQ